MEFSKKMTLESTLASIEETLEPKDIISDLISDGIMNTDDMDEVQTTVTRIDRVRIFIQILQRRGRDAFDSFLQALTKRPYYRELVEIIRTHENCYKGPKPLCIPGNWTYSEGVLACKDASRRGDLLLCKEGLDILRSIGEYPVIPISVTGPTRSGKSSLMSRLVKGLKFEVGHSLESNTTGIWIAVSPRPVSIQGVEARIVLLDAEGSDSVIKAERDIVDGWDMKVFAVCYFVSSLMIYNSSSLPNKSDLQRLHFIAEFSDSVFGITGNNTSQNIFSGCTQSFIWLFRNVTLRVKNNDWKTYLEEKVFSKNGSHSDDTHRIRNAIYKLFSSFSALALPAPSTDPEVCADLDNPEYKDDLKKFFTEFENVKCKIFSNASIKKISEKQVTGKDLADILDIYISQINENGNDLLAGDLWNNTLSLWTQRLLDTAKETLSSKCNKIKLPCDVAILDTKLTDFEQELRDSFNKSYKPRKTSEDQKSLEKLQKIIDTEKVDVIRKNEEISEKVCRHVAKSLVEDHYYQSTVESIQEDPVTKIETLQKLKANMLNTFFKQTKGFPKADEMFNDSVVPLDEEIKGLERLVLVESISSEVTTRMENILPCKIEDLEVQHKLFWDETCANYEVNDILASLGLLERTGFTEIMKKKSAELLKSMLALNETKSQEKCLKIINSFISRLNGNENNGEGVHIKSMNEFRDEYKELATGPCSDRVYLENEKRLKKARKKAKSAQRCNMKGWIQKLCSEM